MGGQGSKQPKHEPTYSLPPHEVTHLRGLYAHLGRRHLHQQQQHVGHQHAIDQELFVSHLELPGLLVPFGGRLFDAFIRAGNESDSAVPPHPHHPARAMTEHQFIVGVEKCCRAGVSHQLRFLSSMYRDDASAGPCRQQTVAARSSTGTQVIEDRERKEQVKAMLCDCTLLAKFLYSQPDAAEEKEKEEEEEEEEEAKEEDAEAEEESEGNKEKKQKQKERGGTLRATGENLHAWEKRAINPMLDGLMLFCEREGSGTDGGRSVDTEAFVAWASDTVTHLFKSTVEVLVRQRFLEFRYDAPDAHKSHAGPSSGSGEVHVPVGVVPFRMPQIDTVLNRKQLILDEARLWILSTALNAQDRAFPWRILYSTMSHGNSFNRLCAALFGYQGNTMLLIRTKNREVFGAYVSCAWQDTTSYYGDSGCFLFSIYPRINVYRTLGKGTNYVYLNTKKTFSELPIGIGFGGDMGNFRLWIDKDFGIGKTRAIDITYRKGPLIDAFNFEIDDIVVWGLGGEDAEEQQLKEKLREQNLTEKMRKVNRQMAAEGWSDGPNKWMMDMVGRTGASNAFLDDLKKDDQRKKEIPLS